MIELHKGSSFPIKLVPKVLCHLKPLFPIPPLHDKIQIESAAGKTMCNDGVASSQEKGNARTCSSRSNYRQLIHALLLMLPDTLPPAKRQLRCSPYLLADLTPLFAMPQRFYRAVLVYQGAIQGRIAGLLP